jgi:GAF domain-containing protein
MGRKKLENLLESHFAELALLDVVEEAPALPDERHGNGQTTKVESQPLADRPTVTKGRRPRVARRGARPTVNQEALDLGWHEIEQAQEAQELSALEQQRLLSNLERRALQLETAAQISRTITSTLDPDELLDQAVELIRERFDLYYVGIFLLDSGGKWAVLKAGTGEAGRKMIASGHQLAVPGHSMIGWCIANEQARIALQVGDETIRFDNPLLPDTLSEMALPLISRARTIGAMTIQSAEPGAFAPDDTVTLQTMADQLANAITNARFHEETERQLEELTVLSDVSRTLAGSLLRPDEIARLIARQFLEVFRVDAAAVSQWEAHTNVLVTLSDLKVEHGTTRIREEGVGVIYPLADYPATATVLQTREPLVVQASDPRSDPSERNYMQSVGAATLFIVPLVLKQQPIGTIEIEAHGRGREFTDQEIDLAMTLANQAAVALENARLFGETLSRAEEMEALNTIATAASGSLDLYEVLAETLDATRRLTGFRAAFAALHHEKVARLELAVQLDLPGPFHRQLVETGFENTLAAAVFQRDEIIVVGDLAAEPDIVHDSSDRFGLHSFIGIPLRHRGRGLGVLCLYDTAAHPHYEARLDLFQAVGNQIAIAIANAQLLEQAESRAEELSTLNAIAGVVSGSLDLQQMLDSTLEMVLAFTGLEVGLYSVQNPHTDRLELACQRNLPANIETRLRERGMRGTLCELVFEKGETHTLDNMATAAPLNVSALVARGLRSYLGVPLKHRGRILGTLCLFSYEDRLPPDFDIELLEAAAREVAVGIANAQLFQETQHALAEAEQAYRRYLSREWEGFLAGTPRARGYVDTPAGLQNGDHFWSPEMEQAVARGDVVILNSDRDGNGNASTALAVPIQLRGQTIGVLDFFHEGEDWTWSQDDEALVRALADQVALALENARLLEKTERRAHRERLASQLAAKIHSAGDTRAILATAAEGLGKALGVSRALVRLSNPLAGSPDHVTEGEEDQQ